MDMILEKTRETQSFGAATDKELLSALRAGHTKVIDILLMRYQGRLYRFSLKMSQHPEDAKDILQETLLTMVRTIQNFRETSSLATWLYKIAYRFYLKKQRKSKFAPKQVHSLEWEVNKEVSSLSVSSKPDEILIRKEIQTFLEETIALLEPEQRQVLVLRDVEGLTTPEVAEILGITTSAVKSRLYRARVNVRNRVAPLLGRMESQNNGSNTCPDILLMYSKHLEGEISVDFCQKMERHVSSCDSCRSTCDSLKQILSLCGNVQEAQVPVEIQNSVRKAVQKRIQ